MEEQASWFCQRKQPCSSTTATNSDIKEWWKGMVMLLPWKVAVLFCTEEGLSCFCRVKWLYCFVQRKDHHAFAMKSGCVVLYKGRIIMLLPWKVAVFFCTKEGLSCFCHEKWLCFLFFYRGRIINLLPWKVAVLFCTEEGLSCSCHEKWLCCFAQTYTISKIQKLRHPLDANPCVVLGHDTDILWWKENVVHDTSHRSIPN